MPFRKDLGEYTDLLREAHGDNLVSVVFYGSATLKDEPGQDEIHLLIALRQITTVDLVAGAENMRTWTKKGYPAPVYFTEAELLSGADVFPIEFNHMKNAHEVIHGKSVLGDIPIENSNIRHQVEFELRSKLLRLRRAVLETSPKDKDLVALMANSLPSFVATLRAAVLLMTGTSHVSRTKVLEEAAIEFGLDADVFMTIFKLRDPKESAPEDAKALFDNYLAQIEKVIKTVDSL
jgi:hypothetical protein